MKKVCLLFLVISVATVMSAQKVILPPFTKWATNNSPGCKNVWLTKDSMLLTVKNKCVSEGIKANWRPSVNIDGDNLRFTVPAGAMAQLTITYKYKAVGGDVLSFSGAYDPESENSDVAFSRSFQMKGGESQLQPSTIYNKAVLLINFSAESSKPEWRSASVLKGSMNFSLNVTSNGGETHEGSTAVIKEVKLEIVK